MKRREIMIVIISFFVIVVMWIILSVYHNSITSTIPDALSLRILSIPDSFDTKTIDQLRKRAQIAPLFDVSTPATPTSQPQPTPIPTPTVVPLNGISVSATTAAQATAGGALK